FCEACRPESGQNCRPHQLLEIAMQVASEAELTRGSLPLATGAQRVEDAIEHRWPRQGLASRSLPPPLAYREHRLEALPKPIGDAPPVVNAGTFPRHYERTCWNQIESN
ncbi:MAG: hypothetical protein NZM29_04995, partial [Nitrospira sp.]|nr:hypothetical protein [Nitrospira sp.]